MFIVRMNLPIHMSSAENFCHRNRFIRMSTSIVLRSGASYESILIRKRTDPRRNMKKGIVYTHLSLDVGEVLNNSHLRKLFTFTICRVGATRRMCENATPIVTIVFDTHPKTTGLSRANE